MTLRHLWVCILLALIVGLTDPHSSFAQLPRVEIHQQEVSGYTFHDSTDFEESSVAVTQLEWTAQPAVEWPDEFEQLPRVPLYNSMRRIVLSSNRGYAAVFFQYTHPTRDEDEDGEVGRLYVLDMKSGSLSGSYGFDDRNTIVHDISDDGRRIITGPDARAEILRMDVWQLEDESVKHVVGWEVETTRPVTYARFTKDNNVVTIDGDHQLTVWEPEPFRMRATLPVRESTGKPPIVRGYEISPDRRFLYASIADRLGGPAEFVVLDLVEFSIKGSVSIGETGVTNVVRVRADGQRLLQICDSSVRIFDNELSLIDEYSFRRPENINDVQWLDDRFFAITTTRNVVVYDTRSRIPVWRFENSGRIKGTILRSCVFVDGMLLSAKNLVRGGLVCQLIPVQLLNDEVLAAVPDDLDEYLRNKPNMTVSMTLPPELDEEITAKIETHFRSELEKLGLQVVDDTLGELHLMSGFEKGEPEVVRYMHPARRGSIETGTIHSMTMAMILYKDNKPIWLQHDTNHPTAPGLVIVTEDKSVQETLDAVSGKVTPEFYLELDIPMHLMLMPENGSIGASVLDYTD